MKERKSIDRIYQENFKDFEREPDKDLWNNIASSLEDNEDKKPVLIPLWLKLGGVAAIMAVILSSLLFLNTQAPVVENPGIVNETEVKPGNDSNQRVNNNIESKYESEDQIVLEENRASNTRNSSNSSIKSPTLKKGLKESNNNQEGSTVINTREKISKAETGIAGMDPQTDDLTPATANRIKIPESFENKTSELILISSPNEDSLAKNIKREDANALASIEADKVKNKEIAIADALADAKRIRISTFAAPVFYKNIGSGNELSNQFADNYASSEVTFSYGLKVAYQVSEKLRIRTGLNKVNISNKISDISYSPTASSAGFENISPVEQNIAIRDNNSSENSLPVGNPDSRDAFSAMVFTPGEIRQQIGYLEIPVEIEFVLLDNRFGLNIIGGGSSLFLDNNQVDLLSEANRTRLGEASNINKNSFSTNIGFGMDYKLSDQFSLSVEPIFKYQLNTFDNVENVQPVNFGIYSGLNFKF